MSFPPSFHETRFPLDIAFGSTGGPERRTDVVSLSSGFEERNTRWAASRRRYNAGYGVKSLADLYAVQHFFEGRRGRLYGFRWRDKLDCKSCAPHEIPNKSDQEIGIGDGTKKNFQLIKKYGDSVSHYTRTITKPVRNTLIVAVDGVVSGTSDYTCDFTTGVVTFAPNAIPANGLGVTAGFEFDVPVRFDTDHIEINLAAFEAGDIPSIPLIEIKV